MFRLLMFSRYWWGESGGNLFIREGYEEICTNCLEIMVMLLDRRVVSETQVFVTLRLEKEGFGYCVSS